MVAVPRRAAAGSGTELTPVNSGGRGGRRRGQGASGSRGQAVLGVGGGRDELGRRLGVEGRAAVASSDASRKGRRGLGDDGKHTGEVAGR